MSRSMTASQQQRALELAKQKTEDVVRQSEAALKLADEKRKAEIELKRIEFAEIAEQQRQKIAEAKLAEAELENMLEADIESISSASSVVHDQAARIGQWISGNEDTAVNPLPFPGEEAKMLQRIKAHKFLTASHPLKIILSRLLFSLICLQH